MAIIDPVADSSGSGGAGSSTDGSVTTTTTSGGNSSLCEAVCNKLAGCVLNPNCAQDCAQPTTCPETQEAWLQCMVDEVATLTCDQPEACLGPIATWANCEELLDPDVEFGCSDGPDGSCACTVQGKQGSVYDTFCDGDGKCQCLLDGASVGSCFDAGSAICDPLESCCGAIFFVDGMP